VGQSLAALIVHLATSMVVARLLNPQEMGIYSVAWSTVALITMLQNFGYTGFIIREPDLTPAKLGSVFCVAALQFLALALALLLVGPAIGWFLHAPQVGHVIQLLAPLALIGIVELVVVGQMQRRMQFRHVALLSFFRILSGNVTTVICALQGLSYWSLPIGQLTGAVLSTIAFGLAGRADLRFRPNFAHWREVFSFGLRIAGSQGVLSIAPRIQDILLGRFAGLAATGMFGRASGVTDMLYNSLYVPFNTVLYSALAEHGRATGDLARPYRRALRLCLTLFFSAYLGLAVLAGPVITLLYGRQWVEAAPILSILALSQLPLIAIALHAEIFLVRNEMGRKMKLDMLRTLVGLVMFGIAATISLRAAAIARLIDCLLCVALYGPFVWRETHLHAADLTRKWLRGLLIAVVTVAPSLTYMQLNDWPLAMPALDLAGVILSGVALWMLMVFAFEPELKAQILDLLTRILKGGNPQPS